MELFSKIFVGTLIYMCIYIYRHYPLDNRYGFSISVQPEITPLLQFIFNV